MDDKSSHGPLSVSSDPLSGVSVDYLEALYTTYLATPDALPASWREYFQKDLSGDAGLSATVPQVDQHAPVSGSLHQCSEPDRTSNIPPESLWRDLSVRQLIDAYRELGHLMAAIDPLGLRDIPDIVELGLEYHGLSEDDLETEFNAEGLGRLDRAPLKDIIALLREVYCESLGVEYKFIPDRSEKLWLRQQLEQHFLARDPGEQEQRDLLFRLTAAETLERYLHSRYVGQKRFSLEGAESLIPMIDTLISRGALLGVQEVAIGMAHRGRLNVLVNILGKSPADLFLEFEGKIDDQERSGDVKYHQGFSSNIETEHGVVHLALAFNPSHLEIASPVVEGSVRARQVRRKDGSGDQVVPILIHGDAAFSGQGVVMETINMSKSRGYSTKGSIHIIIDNQIGFTTSNKRDARSSLYCSDVARMVNAPVFHVNGDDPEAVVFVAGLALEYRMRYRKDVVIDLVCYRRHGHSEADEPSVTQPMMYRTIRALPTIGQQYGRRLIEGGVVNDQDLEVFIDRYRQSLDDGECVAPQLVVNMPPWDTGSQQWQAFHGDIPMTPVGTMVDLERIRELTARMLRLPKKFELHKAVAKIFDDRRKMVAGALPIDWGCAENLAYATLLDEGFPVRLSGQDTARGAFFHRHASVYNMQTGGVYVPLRHLRDDQPEFMVTNSLLSEEAVLAFEYGYATTDPGTLVIWEAQFGDFANNAQVVFDQFISAGEQKWNRLCGLVVFLPHGYEGQGPEHSSARLERYLQLCAEHNIQICIPSTPAQMFHMLRRQMHIDCRKPLIVFTPKSLLRHKLSVSSLEDLTQGGYQNVIPEIDEVNADEVSRVVICSGKVFFDLLEKRRQDGRKDVAIVRVEQLYPFPSVDLKTILDSYPMAHDIVWCQEEPMNQGAWYSSQHHIRSLLGSDDRLVYAGRPSSAAPAVGYPMLHIRQLCQLLEDALGSTQQARQVDGDENIQVDRARTAS